MSAGPTTIPLSARPLTEADAAALRSKREELSNQITSANRRRSDLVQELRRSPEGIARVGVEQRLAVLDERIVQLEKDIAENGRALASAPQALAVSQPVSTEFGGFSSGQLTAMTIVFIVVVLAPIAMALARAVTRRAVQPKPSPQLLEGTARLERIEQAIDSIAVEVERISEGQRFVTQLMAGKPQESVLIEERHEVPDGLPR